MIPKRFAPPCNCRASLNKAVVLPDPINQPIMMNRGLTGFSRVGITLLFTAHPAQV